MYVRGLGEHSSFCRPHLQHHACKGGVTRDNCALNVTGLWGAREHNSEGSGAVCGGHQEDSIFHSKHNQNHIAIILSNSNRRMHQYRHKCNTLHSPDLFLFAGDSPLVEMSPTKPRRAGPWRCNEHELTRGWIKTPGVFYCATSASFLNYVTSAPRDRRDKFSNISLFWFLRAWRRDEIINHPKNVCQAVQSSRGLQ
jgi:hypothetical protein